MHLRLGDVAQLRAGGVWLFPKLRVVEVYLAFFRAWLRRELRRGKYKDLEEKEFDSRVASEESD